MSSLPTFLSQTPPMRVADFKQSIWLFPRLYPGTVSGHPWPVASLRLINSPIIVMTLIHKIPPNLPGIKD
jgi:hypothetical protein